MDNPNGRLKKELSEVCKNDAISGVKAVTVDGDFRTLKGSIKGPVNTCYEGGVFEIEIRIPPQVQ